ncbi:unnamed protein product [Arctia plantaginis]|uniref:Reverse transcriptase n=1 Tax=Arctia plantaginis TaxID=874455 RepID=A0A8S1ALW0_ARCPL|nr:unnamed protein product [Arctia plantaginis]
MEEWLERRHGTLSYRLTQVITGKGCFGNHLCLIRKEPTPECHHCDGQTVDTALHTLAECPAWVEQRRDLVAAIEVGVLSLDSLIAAIVRSESAWNSAVSFCEQVMLAKETAERDPAGPPGPGTGQVPQATQAPEVAERPPFQISAGLGVTGEAICHPSRSRPGGRRARCEARSLPGSRGNMGFPHGGSSTCCCRWPEVCRGTRDFLSRVYLVPRLLVIETACGFSRFESDMPPIGGIRGDFRTEKKRGAHDAKCGFTRAS